jgi:superfamily II DNA/RNA helicase
MNNASNPQRTSLLFTLFLFGLLLHVASSFQARFEAFLGSSSSSFVHQHNNKYPSSGKQSLSLSILWSQTDETTVLSDGQLVEETFAELYSKQLPGWLLRKCTECGWEKPSRIQLRALDAILLDKKDVIIQAETGSGKTLSYLLPCLASVDASRSAVQAMIVVPTRELGMQVARVAKRLAGASSGDGGDKIMIMSVLQGSQNKRQRAWAWAEPPHVVIGTPEELCNMVRYGGIKRYNSVHFLVVDEVDACLLNNAGSLTSSIQSSVLHELLSKHLSPTFDDGTGIDVNTDTELQQAQKASTSSRSQQRPLSQKRQTVFCSATIPQHRHFMKQCIQNQWVLRRDPEHICLQSGEQLLSPTLEHAFTVCRTNTSKLAGLRRLILKIFMSSTLDTPKKVLIFCDPQRPMYEMAQVIDKDLQKKAAENTSFKNVITSVLRLEDNLSQRAAALESFRGEDRYAHLEPEAYTLRILISNDLAARGLDVADVSHIIQFDLPSDADTYCHRSGRAGRFGKGGQVLTIIAPEQEFVLNRLANKLNIDLRCIGRQKDATE